MIRLLGSVNEGWAFHVEFRDRYGVYLDTDSLIEMARGSPQRRERFVRAIHLRGTLLFSLASAAEVGRLKGRTASTVARLLTAVGPWWVPLDLNPHAVVRREAEEPESAPISEDFVNGFARHRRLEFLKAGRTDFAADDFFDLGAVVALAQSEHDSVKEDLRQMDDSVRSLIGRLRRESEKNPSALDAEFPAIAFDETRRATFVRNHLIRLLVSEAKSHRLKRNDGLDFCHAVIATAYCHIVALDGPWQRRVGCLPTRVPRRESSTDRRSMTSCTSWSSSSSSNLDRGPDDSVSGVAQKGPSGSGRSFYFAAWIGVTLRAFALGEAAASFARPSERSRSFAMRYLSKTLRVFQPQSCMMTRSGTPARLRFRAADRR